MSRFEDEFNKFYDKSPRRDIDFIYHINRVKIGRRMSHWFERDCRRSIKDMRVLDLGCGKGGVGIAFASRGADVTSTDIMEMNIKLTLALAMDNEVCVDTSVQDVHYLGFKNETFDIVLAFDLFEHIIDREKVIMEMARVLKEEGYVIFSTSIQYSIFNIVADPHRNLPGVILLPYSIKKRFYPLLNIRMDSHKWFKNKDEILACFQRHGIEFQHDLTREFGKMKFDSEQIEPTPRKKVIDFLRRLGLNNVVEYMFQSPIFYGTVLLFGQKRGSKAL